MAIEKGRLTESFTVVPKVDEENKKTFAVTESADSKGKLVLRPRIECIHSGMTRNKTLYTAERLKGDPRKHSGVYSWTYPYPKPMLKNHDTDSEPTGRIESAMFVTNSLTGKESSVIIPTITDPDTIEKILDGRYLTVSIGATTDAAICSICGKNLVEEGWCGHDKGETYEGQECYWIIGELWFDECSWVNVPSDSDAQIIDKGEVAVMETYAQREGVTYDLGKKSGEQGYLVTEQLATIEGLVIKESSVLNTDNPEEGGKDMPDPIENTEAGTVVKPEETPVVKEPEVTEGSDQILQQKEDEIEELKAQKEATCAMLNLANETLLQAEAQVEALGEQINALQGDVVSLKEEKNSLLDSNADLSAKIHKTTVERVVDLKVSLGKPGFTSREEAIASLISRTSESLNDTLTDLLNEQLTFGSRVIVSNGGSVTNPAGGAVNGERSQTIEGNDPNANPIKAKEMTVEDVLVGLFSGKKSLSK